jgi:uncharacterized protein (DUF433 family)
MNCDFHVLPSTLQFAQASPASGDLRFPVARLLGLLAAGETRDQILAAYPYLEPGDTDEALRYAAFLAEDEAIELVPRADA